MTSHTDKTLKDTIRRDLNVREQQIDSLLPSVVLQEYPKFVTFLKKYFELQEQDESLNRFLNNVFETRDITQTDRDLLQYFEDDYLLGQNYFQGFDDKRTAVQYSSYLYRTKGTRYSIRQFFKTFFSIEPDVVYTKQYIFKLNESKVGAESARYLTDNKLYQTYAIQIRSELSVAQWRDAYKLLVHPAGMYLGGLTQIVGTGSFEELQFDPGEAIKPPIVLEGVADFDERGFAQHTALFDINNPTDTTGDRIQFRMIMGSGRGGRSPSSDYPAFTGNDLNDVGDLTVDQLDRLYSSMGEFLSPNSPTLDDDSDGTSIFTGSTPIGEDSDVWNARTGTTGFDISSTETIDQERFDWNPTINRIDSDNLLFGGGLTPVGDSDSELSLRNLIDGQY